MIFFLVFQDQQFCPNLDPKIQLFLEQTSILQLFHVVVSSCHLILKLYVIGICHDLMLQLFA